MAKTFEQKQKAAETRATLFGNDPDELRANLTTTRQVAVGKGDKTQTRTKFDKDAFNIAKTTFNNRGNEARKVGAQNRGAGGGSGVSETNFGPGAISVGGVDTFTAVNSKQRGR